jgi:large subunit ribosomal protein L3
MSVMLFGTKLGMTRLFDDKGNVVPVTVLSVGPCVVTQVRSTENDGYSAVQIGFGEMKPRNATFQIIAHDAKAGSGPLRKHAEFKIKPEQAGEYALGKALTVEVLKDAKYVDVIGTSKGKGFQGSMKRHGFKGMCDTHGTERKHRSPGSIGSHASNRGYGGGLKKGKLMAGHMGDERVTARSLDVVKIDLEQGLLVVKGAVPGANNGTIMVRSAIRLNRSKANKAAGKVDDSGSGKKKK